MGGFLIWTCPFCPFMSLKKVLSFLGFSRFFLGFSPFFRGFSRLVLLLFLGLHFPKSTYEEQSRKGRDTIRTFPEKIVNPSHDQGNLVTAFRIEAISQIFGHCGHMAPKGPCDTKSKTDTVGCTRITRTLKLFWN